MVINYFEEIFAILKLYFEFIWPLKDVPVKIASPLKENKTALYNFNWEWELRGDLNSKNFKFDI